MSKRTGFAILIVLTIVLGGGFYFNSSKNLQGSFSAVNQDVTKEVTTGAQATEELLMSIDTAGSGSVTLTKGSTEKAVLGKWKVSYKNDAGVCNVSFGLSDNGEIKDLYSSAGQTEKYLDDTQLAVLIDDAASTFRPNDMALSLFTPAFTPKSGKSYTFYLYGYAPSDAANLSNGILYMTTACARPSTGGYDKWDAEDSSGQNGYFSVDTDATGFGIPGGTKVNIQ